MLKPFVHNITFVNRLEFAKHETVARELDYKTFFAKPYHSWEKGLNGNFNGLLRQYFPKSFSLKGLETKQVLEDIEQINQRSRNVLISIRHMKSIKDSQMLTPVFLTLLHLLVDSAIK